MNVGNEIKIDKIVYANFLLGERFNRALELRNQYISNVKIKRRCNIYRLLNLKPDYSNEECVEIINDFIFNGLSEFANNLIDIEYYCMNSYGIKQDMSFRLRGILGFKSKDILSLLDYKSKYLSKVNKDYINRAQRVYITSRSILKDKLLNFRYLKKNIEIISKCLTLAEKWIDFINKEFILQSKRDNLIGYFEQFIDLAKYNLRMCELDIFIITRCVEGMDTPIREFMVERFLKGKSLVIIEDEMLYTYEYISSSLSMGLNKLLPLYENAKREYILELNQR